MFEHFFIGLENLPWYYKIIFYPIYYLGHAFLAVVHYLTPHTPFGIFLMFAISFWLIKKNGWAKIFWVLAWTLHFIRYGFSTARRNNARKRLARTNPNYIYRK